MLLSLYISQTNASAYSEVFFCYVRFSKYLTSIMKNYTAKNPTYSCCHIPNHVVYPERCLFNCPTNTLKINLCLAQLDYSYQRFFISTLSTLNHQLMSINIRHTVFEKNIDIIILLSQDDTEQSTLVMHPKQRWVSYVPQHP